MTRAPGDGRAGAAVTGDLGSIARQGTSRTSTLHTQTQNSFVALWHCGGMVYMVGTGACGGMRRVLCAICIMRAG